MTQIRSIALLGAGAMGGPIAARHNHACTSRRPARDRLRAARSRAALRAGLRRNRTPLGLDRRGRRREPAEDRLQRLAAHTGGERRRVDRAARALGVDPERFLEVVAVSPADSPMLRIAGDDMLRGSFEPGLTVEHARKDALLIVDAARTAGVAPHMTHGLLDRALALGLADGSFAAMVLATGS